jgi:hypothetical protein
VLALASVAPALADSPTVKIRKADQATAVAALLHQSDFGAGWRGGPTTPSKLTAPSCPGFNPKESDLVVNGHAEARFTFRQSGVQFDQDVQVLVNAAAVQKDFARTVKPQLAGCLAYQIRKASNVTQATVTRIKFPPVGTVSAAYRATVVVHGSKGPGRFLSDYVFFGEGRLEYAFNVVAPVGAGDQLVRFESAMAEILLRRLGAAPA